MTLATYITALLPAPAPPDYPWSDWACRDYYMWDAPDEYLIDVSDAAALALTLGAAQWIRARLSPLDKDPVPSQAIAAGWAFMAEPNACLYYEPTDALWRGPVRAPLSVSMVILMDALYCRDADPEVRTRTHWMANLARHVLGKDAATFDQWFDWAAAHLAVLHPRSDMPKLGLFDIPERFEPAVGPSALVPGAAYDKTRARQEIYDMLMAGDRSNSLINYAALRP